MYIYICIYITFYYKRYFWIKSNSVPFAKVSPVPDSADVISRNRINRNNKFHMIFLLVLLLLLYYDSQGHFSEG